MSSVNSFIRNWNSMSGQIDAVYLYLHGDPGRLNFKGEYQYLSIKKHHNVKHTFYDLKPKKIKGIIYLFSCFGGKDSYIGSCYMGCVGEILSRRNNCTVFASTGGVSYSKADNGKYYARPGLKPSKFGQWIKFYPGKSIFGNPKIFRKKLGWYILV